MIKGIDNIRRIECCRDDNIRCVVILKRGEELETKRKNRMNKNGMLITRQENTQNENRIEPYNFIGYVGAEERGGIIKEKKEREE